MILAHAGHAADIGVWMLLALIVGGALGALIQLGLERACQRQSQRELDKRADALHGLAQEIGEDTPPDQVVRTR